MRLVPRLPLAALMLAVLTTTVACGDDGPAGPGGNPPGTVTTVSVESGATLIRNIAVTVDAPSGIQIDYWTTGHKALRRLKTKPATDHFVLLPRLVANRTYDYEIRPIGTNGELGDPVTGQFHSDRLPGDLAAVQFTATGTVTHPVLLELRAHPFYGFVLVDSHGHVVWFYRTQMERTAHGMTRLANGNFIFMEGDRFVEVTPSVRVLQNVNPAAPPHHDLETTPQNTILYLSKDPLDYGGTTWEGEAIWEWNPATGAEAKLWSSHDFIDPTDVQGPRSVPDDYLHANSLDYGPRGNIVMSLFFMEQTISISADFQSLEWKLFGPDATYQEDADAVAFGQHTAREISENRVIVFDNGWARPDSSKFSRALEVEIDPQSNRVRKVWEFRPDQDNHSRVISSARRIDNGNTVVTFGSSDQLAGSTGPIEVYEVDSSASVVWHLVVSNARNIYRGTPIPDIRGEFVPSGP